MNMPHWEELRRQARLLENELDGKLAMLGKLGSSHGSRGSTNGTTQRDSSQSYGLLCSGIDDLLRRLTQVNEQMSTHVPIGDTLSSNRSSDSPTPGLTAGGLSQQHTVKRHREILRDYADEFRQIKSKVVAAKEREDLLGSVYRDLATRDALSQNGDSTGDGSRPSSPTNSSTRLLLEEQDRYIRSSRMIDDHLTTASAVRSALRAQRMALRSASAHLHGLTARFPILNKLVGQINWRHRKDTVILAVVIAFCILLMMIYILS